MTCDTCCNVSSADTSPFLAHVCAKVHKRTTGMLQQLDSKCFNPKHKEEISQRKLKDTKDVLCSLGHKRLTAACATLLCYLEKLTEGLQLCQTLVVHSLHSVNNGWIILVFIGNKLQHIRTVHEYDVSPEMQISANIRLTALIQTASY